MKEILFTVGAISILVGGIFFAGFASGGCISYPDRKDADCPACYDYQVCLYMSAKNKIKSDCKEEFSKCCKARSFIFCRDENNRPKEVRFQECFDKLQ